MDLETIPALSVDISLSHPGRLQTKSVCVRRQGSCPATAGDSSFKPGTHAERMTLLITGPSRIQVIKQGGLCLLGYVPPGVPAHPASQLLLSQKRKGVLLPVSPAHTDSSWEQNRERSLGKRDQLRLGAGLHACSSKRRDFPELYGNPSPVLLLRASFSAR